MAKLRGGLSEGAKSGAPVYVRGGGGCQHYKEEGRIAKNVVPRKPDLVFIGGISQKDIESIREVIHQLRAGLPDVEILLATGTFGTTDPRSPEELAKDKRSGASEYGAALKKLAAEERCAFLEHDGAVDRIHAIRQGSSARLLSRPRSRQRVWRANPVEDPDRVFQALNGGKCQHRLRDEAELRSVFFFFAPVTSWTAVVLTRTLVTFPLKGSGAT